MVRRLSRSTFAFVSSLIRYGRVNGGKGLQSKPTTKSLPASEANSTEKTPLLCDKTKGLPSNDRCKDCDVESQAHNLKVDLKSGPLSSLSAAATAMAGSGPGHKRTPSKEDLETVLPTGTGDNSEAGGNTEMEVSPSPPTKRFRQEPGTEAVVTIVNEVSSMEAKKSTKNSVSEAGSSSSPVKEHSWRNKSPKADNPRPRMNYFVAIQVQDSEVCDQSINQFTVLTNLKCFGFGLGHIF